jgi:hypothetical protein
LIQRCCTILLGASLGAMAVFTLARCWLRPQARRWLERRVVSQEGLRVLPGSALTESHIQP